MRTVTERCWLWVILYRDFSQENAIYRYMTLGKRLTIVANYNSIFKRIRGFFTLLQWYERQASVAAWLGHKPNITPCTMFAYIIRTLVSQHTYLCCICMWIYFLLWQTRAHTTSSHAAYNYTKHTHTHACSSTIYLYYAQANLPRAYMCVYFCVY